MIGMALSAFICVYLRSSAAKLVLEFAGFFAALRMTMQKAFTFSPSKFTIISNEF